MKENSVFALLMWIWSKIPVHFSFGMAHSQYQQSVDLDFLLSQLHLNLHRISSIYLLKFSILPPVIWRKQIVCNLQKSKVLLKVCMRHLLNVFPFWIIISQILSLKFQFDWSYLLIKKKHSGHGMLNEVQLPLVLLITSTIWVLVDLLFHLCFNSLQNGTKSKLPFFFFSWIWWWT